jgi:hypothetical protein
MGLTQVYNNAKASFNIKILVARTAFELSRDMFVFEVGEFV